MTTKTIKTILFASLIATMILPFSAMNFAFAEVSDEIKNKALEGKQIWKKLDKIKDKISKTEQDKVNEKKLQMQFDKIVKELNKECIATQEQWDADPEYWRTVNLSSVENVVNHSIQVNSIQTNSFNPGFTSSNAEIMSHTCGCSQALNFIAGFDYLL